tara:strand:- start:324 stop:542 length:219 start_codon:yes stop_codon:yes gene_type:complete
MQGGVSPGFVDMTINTPKKEYAINAYSFSAHGELLRFMQQLTASFAEQLNARRIYFLSFNSYNQISPQPHYK